VIGLRRHRVALYAYSSAPDADGMGVQVSTYTKVRSRDADGHWWAAFGTKSSREAAPTTAAQHETMAVFGLDGAVLTYAPQIGADSVVVDSAHRVWRITGVETRATHGDTVQLHAVHVDDADAFFALVTPEGW
jgi:hypothetical protein